MLEQVTKWLSVFILSMIKFIGGPVSATALGLSTFETIMLSVLGMMTSVLLFSTLGYWFKANVMIKFKKPNLFTKKSRRMVSLWQRFGMQGVAFLTPIIFSPIIGTMVATSFGVSKRKIFVYMLISSIFWAIVLTFSLQQLKLVVTPHA
ncbi:MAG: hypothetical protein SFY32_02540 [Bacteroidota bacterium]|nr:hypothetical protein [Bacteroidota bacterium]